MNSLVSIITPSFNSSVYIVETIESVQKQTYTEWEMLITDDGSTDNTVDIISSYASDDRRIKLFQFEKNSGSGPARNKSIQEAKGKYLAFLDSDDIWVHNKLETQVKMMEENNIVFSHSSYGYIDDVGSEIRKPFIVSSYPINYQDLLKRTEISCLTAIYNQEVIGKIYMPKIRHKQDYALWLSILKRGHVSAPQQEVLGYYRQRRGSATNKKYSLILKHYNFLREQEKLSVYCSLKYSAHWIWNGLLKYYL